MRVIILFNNKVKIYILLYRVSHNNRMCDDFKSKSKGKNKTFSFKASLSKRLSLKIYQTYWNSY